VTGKIKTTGMIATGSLVFRDGRDSPLEARMVLLTVGFGQIHPGDAFC